MEPNTVALVSESISVPGQSVALKAAERKLGAVLIHAGRLRPQDVEHILQLQRQKGLRFGGARTLLIDADLRQPCLHRLFGLDNRAGLSAVLSGRAAAFEALQRVASLPNLSVLPAGALPPSPQDLLARPAFAQLLQQLAAHVDLILLDCPPVAQNADAQTIAVRAGAALIVVRKHSSCLWRVQGISDSVVQAKCTIVGAVLNDF